MSSPKIKPAQKLQTPVEIDDGAVLAAKDEATRRAKGKGYLGTVLTGLQGGGAPSTLKTVLGG